MRYLLHFIFVLILVTSLSACYHPDINQGNNYKPELIQSLKPGMQKQAVIDLLGDPVLKSPFDSNTLIYVYYNYPNSGPTTKRHVTLQFKDDVLMNIQDNA